jgi:hypothetical protein
MFASCYICGVVCMVSTVSVGSAIVVHPLKLSCLVPNSCRNRLLLEMDREESGALPSVL